LLDAYERLIGEGGWCACSARSIRNSSLHGGWRGGPVLPPRAVLRHVSPLAVLDESLRDRIARISMISWWRAFWCESTSAAWHMAGWHIGVIGGSGLAEGLGLEDAQEIRVRAPLARHPARWCRGSAVKLTFLAGTGPATPSRPLKSTIAPMSM
jgi:hypothetical protein